MKLQTKTSSVLASNLDQKETTFAIGDVSVVIDILRNRLYSRPIQTLVQEYVCNARDACREKYPEAWDEALDVEIKLPNTLSPVFSVRDFGGGISDARMYEIFIKYGSSTKRTSNQTGGFGIGAKSAWSYTDSFTIVSVVDGEKSSYLAHTGTKNEGTLTLLSRDKSDERTGTEIQISVLHKDVKAFRQAYNRAVLLWPKKPRVLNLDPDDTAPEPYVALSLPSITIMKAPGDAFASTCGAGSVAGISLDADGIAYGINASSQKPSRSLNLRAALLQGEGMRSFLRADPEKMDISASREGYANSQNDEEYLQKAETDIIAHAKNLWNARIGETGKKRSILYTLSLLSDQGIAFCVESLESGWQCPLGVSIDCQESRYQRQNTPFAAAVYMKGLRFLTPTHNLRTGGIPSSLPLAVNQRALTGSRDALVILVPGKVSIPFHKNICALSYLSLSAAQSLKIRYAASRGPILLVVGDSSFKGSNDAVEDYTTFDKYKEQLDEVFGEYTNVADLPLPPKAKRETRKSPKITKTQTAQQTMRVIGCSKAHVALYARFIDPKATYSSVDVAEFIDETGPDDIIVYAPPAQSTRELVHLWLISREMAKKIHLVEACKQAAALLSSSTKAMSLDEFWRSMEGRGVDRRTLALRYANLIGNFSGVSGVIQRMIAKSTPQQKEQIAAMHPDLRIILDDIATAGAPKEFHKLDDRFRIPDDLLPIAKNHSYRHYQARSEVLLREFPLLALLNEVHIQTAAHVDILIACMTPLKAAKSKRLRL